MKDEEGRSRRRGVRASRAKLMRALMDAGLKTQAALAERIADLEGLETPPKDVVNRVFREQPVDLATLERVARALQTPAYQLYLTADEPGFDAAVTRPIDGGGATGEHGPSESADETTQPQQSEAPPSTPIHIEERPAWWRWAAVAAAAVVAIGAGAFWLRSVPHEVEQQAAAVPLQPKFGRFKVAMAQFAGDASGELQELVRERLEQSLGVSSAALPVIAPSADRSEIAQRFRVDVVLDGEVVKVGEWVGVRAYAYHDSRGRREQIWAESFHVSTQPRAQTASADRIVAAVKRSLGLFNGDSRNPPHFPLAAVHDNYLQGRWYLDRAPSELNLRRAQGNFESALRHDSNYAAAHAGVCEVALNAVWIDSEARQLADAEKACLRAMQLDPNAPETIRAYAYFLMRSGRADEGATMLRKLVAEYPDDTENWLSLANAEFARYRRAGEAKYGEAAIASARAATERSPDFWKPWMWLGVYSAAASTRDDAVAAFEQAYRFDDANEYVVANLGTMYFCRGDFSAARDLYLKAKEVAPQSYVGDETLGQVYYYLKDFAESARLRQRALDLARGGSNAEIHQMWGALADSYRQAGDRDEAIDAYVRALEIVERDFLMGNGTSGDKASRAYYYLALQALDGSRRPPVAALAAFDRELDEAQDANTESAALLRVAQSRLLQKQYDKARAALKMAVARCPCYAEFPDLAELVGTSE
jgi:tetratricopeptide (TPR) repeat protein